MNNHPFFTFVTLVTLTSTCLVPNTCRAQEYRADYSAAYESNANQAEDRLGGSIATASYSRTTVVPLLDIRHEEAAHTHAEHVRVWGVSREAKYVFARWRTTRTPTLGGGQLVSRSGALEVRLAGLTVVSASTSSPGTWSGYLAPAALYGSGQTRQLSVFGVSVGVKVRVSADCTYSMTRDPERVMLSGTVSGNVAGSSSATSTNPSLTVSTSGPLQFASMESRCLATKPFWFNNFAVPISSGVTGVETKQVRLFVNLTLALAGLHASPVSLVGFSMPAIYVNESLV